MHHEHLPPRKNAASDYNFRLVLFPRKRYTLYKPLFKLTMNLLAQIDNNIRPQVESISSGLKMFSFKKTMGTPDPDEIETVIAYSIGHAVEQRPELLHWYVHQIDKNIR